MTGSVAIAAVLTMLAGVAGMVYASSRRRAPREDTRLGDLRRIAYERATSGIGFVDAEGHWLFFNDRLLHTLGYEAAELRRTTLRQLTHPQDRKREATLFGALQGARKPGYTIVKRLRRKDGLYQEYRVQLTRITESPVVHQCTIDKVRSDAPLLDQVVEALFELAEVAVLRCDNTNTITGWNRGAERLFGYTPAEIVGSNWARLTPGATPAVIRDASKPLRGGGSQPAEVRIRRDGEQIAVHSTIVRYGGSQELSGFIEVCHAWNDPAAASSSGESPEVLALRGDVARYVALEAGLLRRIGSEQRANLELSDRVQSLATELRILADSKDISPAEAPVPDAGEAEAASSFVGSSSGKLRIYHRQDCISARQLAEREQLVFGTPDEAEAQQFRACKRCLPRSGATV